MLDQEQDKDWAKNRHIELFNRFCDLVVNHYRESREVKYYADQLSLTPKYLSKVIRETTGGISPSEWIEQYVTAQAKHLIESHATPTLQETAYELGFYEHCLLPLFQARYWHDRKRIPRQ